MKQTKNLYFCSHCKSSITSSKQLIFIENQLRRPFCSEECASEFFAPLIQRFAQEEAKFRGLNRIEDHLWTGKYKDDNAQLAQVISSPEEVWRETNDLGEQFLTLIRRFHFDEGEATYVLICGSLGSRPSFIFHHTLTAREELLEYYRSGIPLSEKELNNSSDEKIKKKRDEFTVSKDVVAELEQKKSSFLASYLGKRKNNDIPLENFGQYDEYTKKTLNTPDEVYEIIDDEGDQLLTYLRSYISEEKMFFHIVVCMPVPGKEQGKTNDGPLEEILLPILAVPSIDEELYSVYQSGRLVVGDRLKN